MMHVFAVFLFLSAAATAHARVDVKTLNEPRPLFELPRKALYAIGKAEGSNDTITVLNGRIYTTRYEKKASAGESEKPTLKIDTSFKTRAAVLTYATVNNWHEAQLAGEARTPSNLGPLMNKMLKETGYERAGRFPFMIKGKITKIHLVSGTSDSPVKISEKQISGIIVGFLTKIFVDDSSQPGAKIPQFRLDMNFVDDAGKTIGVVEDFNLDEKNKVALFMPR